MSGLYLLSTAVCCICVGVATLQTLIPQKRTRRVMSLAIGLFFLSSLLTCIATQSETLRLSFPQEAMQELPAVQAYDFTEQVAQQTADQLTQTVGELLQNERISVQDVRLALKISDQGSITVARVVIYINESYADRTDDIERIIYRNLSKEPEIYVEGKKLR